MTKYYTQRKEGQTTRGKWPCAIIDIGKIKDRSGKPAFDNAVKMLRRVTILIPA
jgi:hypothetical protein